MSYVEERIELAPGWRRLALTRAGRGAPAVVFESGLGAESDEWDAVFRAVSPWTTVMRYDRANRGRSDPAPRPRTAQELAADLHALLAAADLPRPILLVGHSLGGLLVRLYAHQHPQEVAALLLVDPMHEDQFDIIGPHFPPPFPEEPEGLTQLRSFYTGGWRDPARNREGVDLVASLAQARTVSSLGDLPLLVLTAGAFLRDAPPDDPAAQQAAARPQALWQALHRGLARQSSQGAQLLVETSGHFVQRDQPEAIVAAVQQVLQRVRNGR